MALPGRYLLSQIKNAKDVETLASKLGIYIERYLTKAIETTAQNAAVSPTSKIKAPAPPESISVTPATTGDMLQVVTNHTAPIQKGVHYIYSIADNPQLSGAMTRIEPATRAPMHFTLPTFKSDGTTKHDYYVGVQVQYPGSEPSPVTYHGGVSPVKVNLNGSAAADLQAGTGSGTAENGGQTAVGLGKAQVRLGQK